MRSRPPFTFPEIDSDGLIVLTVPLRCLPYADREPVLRAEDDNRARSATAARGPSLRTFSREGQSVSLQACWKALHAPI